MLLDILTDIAAEEGIILSNTQEHARLVALINQAAKELYEASDLRNSLDEDTFDFSTTDATNQVALPWYVGQIRGMRYADGYGPRIELNDPKNRYGHGLDTEVWPLRTRQKKESAISRSISNESVLRLVIPLAEPTQFSVTVVGQTSNSNRYRETITFAPGDIETYSVGNYKGNIEVIRKSDITVYDLSIYDVEEHLLSVIPNSLLQAKYQILQVYDARNGLTPNTTTGVEVIYKKTFVPLEEDFDEFVCGNIYDKAIYWKYKEQQASDVQAAISFQVKSNQVINQIEADYKNGVREVIDFVPRGFFNLRSYYPVDSTRCLR